MKTLSQLHDWRGAEKILFRKYSVKPTGVNYHEGREAHEGRKISAEIR
jgi:hypothetical protein